MDDYKSRYQRQIILKELGEPGQRKLTVAKVLVIGAGGLGCPVLLYLAAAGVGVIGLADDDLVAENNLHRQVLYDMQDIGKPKVHCAKAKLEKLNPGVVIKTYQERVTNINALEIFAHYDLVIDGTDNFSTRYVINDACCLLEKPLVYAAVSRFEGQVAVFNCKLGSGKRSSNYRDLFPLPPAEDEILNCEEAGVIGTLTGIIGGLQATEAIKIIAGIGKPLINRLLTYDALSGEFFELELSQDLNSAAGPSDAVSFRQMNYELFCGLSTVEEITLAEFEQWIGRKNTLIIDVREENEEPVVNNFEHIRYPLSKLKTELPDLTCDTLICFCQSGKRSRTAASILRTAFGNSKQIFSLNGGIVNWINQMET